jgi:hypothetical protein
MQKKLIASCVALTAYLAVAVAPSLVSANPLLTHPTGTVAAAGTKVVATNVGETVFTTPFGNVTCSTVTLTGSITSNSTAAGFDIEVTSATEGGTGPQAPNEPHTECTSWTGGVSVTPSPATNGLPWCIQATASNDAVQIRGGGCPALARATRFTLVFTSIGTCVYQWTSAMSGTLLTHPTDAVLQFTEQEWTKLDGPALCPGSGKMDVSFTLETDTGGEPIYISS